MQTLKKKRKLRKLRETSLKLQESLKLSLRGIWSNTRGKNRRKRDSKDPEFQERKEPKKVISKLQGSLKLAIQRNHGQNLRKQWKGKKSKKKSHSRKEKNRKKAISKSGELETGYTEKSWAKPEEKPEEKTAERAEEARQEAGEEAREREAREERS